MIRTYSKRLLMPYVGVIQVAEMDRARALSTDGENWAIQYVLAEDKRTLTNKHVTHPSSHYHVVDVQPITNIYCSLTVTFIFP